MANAAPSCIVRKFFFTSTVMYAAKRISASLFLLLFLLVQPGAAQEKGHTGMIVIDPFKFWQFYNLSYYHAILPRLALGVGAQIPASFGERDLEGVGFTAEARFQLSEALFDGPYVGAALWFDRFRHDEYIPADQREYGDPSSRTLDESHLSTGALLGWHISIWEGLGAEASVGVEYNISPTTEANTPSIGSHNGGFVPAARMMIGYAW